MPVFDENPVSQPKTSAAHVPDASCSHLFFQLFGSSIVCIFLVVLRVSHLHDVLI
jgi:hypothetical protein